MTGDEPYDIVPNGPDRWLVYWYGTLMAWCPTREDALAYLIDECGVEL